MKVWIGLPGEAWSDAYPLTGLDIRSIHTCNLVFIPMTLCWRTPIQVLIHSPIKGELNSIPDTFQTGISPRERAPSALSDLNSDQPRTWYVLVVGLACNFLGIGNTVPVSATIKAGGTDSKRSCACRLRFFPTVDYPEEAPSEYPGFSDSRERKGNVIRDGPCRSR